ncbi:MAG: phosphoglucosamine mutase [Bacillota bacterium]
MGQLFGTDGVRGVANRDLTPELACKLGQAGGYYLTQDLEQPTILIGKDTRISGDMLESALIAGLNSVGIDVLQAGIIPTPVVAYLTKELEVDAGIMISASHNPVADNGIKFFQGNGLKLTDQMEAEIEELITNQLAELPQPIDVEVGMAEEVLEPLLPYFNHIKEIITEDLSDLKVVVDAANGAAFELAPQLLRELGIETVALNDLPDGTNINLECGSTHPQELQEAVVEEEADAGIALDGDGDRLIAVDETGAQIDGDLIMAICGRQLIREDELPENTVVATRYSNLGLQESLAELDGQVVTTKNGDRYVLAEMLEHGYKLGGEKSGHIIFLDYNTTGDGMLTALQLLETMVKQDTPLSKLATEMTAFPQLLVNVEVAKKEEWQDNQALAEVISNVEEQLGESGRVFVRASGTEPVIRIMVEGKDKAQLDQLATQISEVVRKELN